jgi:ankyrin repeat protein
VLRGFSVVANYLIITHGVYVNAKCGCHGTPLHAVSYEGHFDAACVLLTHGADVNATNKLKKASLCSAYFGGHMDAMRLLLERGADAYVHLGLILHDASYHGRIDVIHLLLQHNVDVNATNQLKNGALHLASIKGQAKIAQLLLGTGLTSMHKVATTTLITLRIGRWPSRGCANTAWTRSGRAHAGRRQFDPIPGGYIGGTCRSCAVAIGAYGERIRG